MTIRGAECGNGDVLSRNGSARVEPTRVHDEHAKALESEIDARRSLRFRLANIPGCGCFGTFRGADVAVDAVAPVELVQEERARSKSMSKSIKHEPKDRSVSMASLEVQRSSEISRSMMDLYRDIERTPSNALERVDDGSTVETYPELTRSESSANFDEGDERPSSRLETVISDPVDWDRLVSRENSAESPDSALTRANERPLALERVARPSGEAASAQDERHTTTRASATHDGES